jgi:DNA-directed RNA polymerase subunit RPC12/RpoP
MIERKNQSRPYFIPDDFEGEVPYMFERKATHRTDDEFKIGQKPEDGQKALEVECRYCGGREFNVGRGKYYTAIRCVECGYEICVHEG